MLESEILRHRIFILKAGLRRYASLDNMYDYLLKFRIGRARAHESSDSLVGSDRYVKPIDSMAALLKKPRHKSSGVLEERLPHF